MSRNVCTVCRGQFLSQRGLRKHITAEHTDVMARLSSLEAHAGQSAVSESSSQLTPAWSGTKFLNTPEALVQQMEEKIAKLSTVVRGLDDTSRTILTRMETLERNQRYLHMPDKRSSEPTWAGDAQATLSTVGRRLQSMEAAISGVSKKVDEWQRPNYLTQPSIMVEAAYDPVSYGAGNPHCASSGT
jgi:hypothetical protein